VIRYAYIIWPTSWSSTETKWRKSPKSSENSTNTASSREKRSEFRSAKPTNRTTWFFFQRQVLEREITIRRSATWFSINFPSNTLYAVAYGQCEWAENIVLLTSILAQSKYHRRTNLRNNYVAGPQRALSERHESFLHNGRAALRAYDRSVSAGIQCETHGNDSPLRSRRGAESINASSAHYRKMLVGITKAAQSCHKLIDTLENSLYFRRYAFTISSYSSSRHVNREFWSKKLVWMIILRNLLEIYIISV
jgi:hypothetical protein